MSTGHVILVIGIVFLCVAVVGGSICGIVLSQMKRTVTRRIQREYR